MGKSTKFKYQILYVMILLSPLLSAGAGGACSVFCIDTCGLLVTGRSYDWSFGEGLVIVNKRGQLKTALTYWSESRDNLASWTSKYGSITFVQYGRDIAFDGMNEAGLVVSELWLEESVYPSVDSRPSLSLDQYVQYLLDNFKTVDEIAASDSLVRLRPTPSNFTKIHFFAADSSGKCIVVEFLGGRMVYHTGAAMPVKAITNNTYESSIAYINRGAPPNPSSNSSLERFYRISAMTAGYDPDSSGDIVSYTFGILDAVKAGSWTKFQTVFDIKNRMMYFKSLQNRQLRYFDFDAFDFSCSTVSMMLDVNADLSGDVTGSFIEYDWRENEAMIKAAWEDLGSSNIYQPALEMISRYPETFECMETVHIGMLPNNKPEEFQLYQNYPNPFNPSTVIRYTLRKPSHVRLAVYNIVGQKVRTLCDGFQASGEYFSAWDATDENGNAVSSGAYFCRLETDRKSVQKKMLVVR